MVVMGVLGAAMVSMLGSSAIGKAWANFGQQAYYLAESGFRYAVSEYKHGGLDALDMLVKEENEDPVEKNVGGGKFGLKVDYEVHVEATEENNLAENFEILYAFRQVDGDGNPIPIQGVTGENVSVSKGDNLRVRLPTDGGVIRELPKYRGRIIANGVEVYYQRVLTTADDDIVTLKKIGFYDEDTDFYLAQYNNVTYGALVFPVRVATINSIGTFPASGLFKANRTINYTWSMGGETSGTGNSEGDEQELFNLPGLEDMPVSLVDDARFHVIPGDKQQEVRIEANVDGEPGVRVKLSNDVSIAFVNINWWLVDGFDVNDAYQYQENTLSYDLQIKMRSTHHSSFYSYLGGVTFRVTANDIPENGNFYGMSFFYARSGAKTYPDWLTTSTSLNDLIADHGYEKVRLVFWKSVGNGIEVIESVDVTDRVMTEDAAVDWGSIVLKIEETGVGTSKVNNIIGIVYNNANKPRGDMEWPDDDLGDENAYDISGTYPHADQPNLSTGTLTEIQEPRPEIGFHVFSDFGAQNVLQVDDFAVRMPGAGGGGGSTPYIPPIQE